MWLQDDTYVPFLYKSALCYFIARKLTAEELRTLEVHDITSGNRHPVKENQKMKWYRRDDDEYHDEDNSPDCIDTYLNEGKSAYSATT